MSSPSVDALEASKVVRCCGLVFRWVLSTAVFDTLKQSQLRHQEMSTHVDSSKLCRDEDEAVAWTWKRSRCLNGGESS